MVKDSACNVQAWVRSLGQEYPLEEEKATYSNILPGKFHGQRSLADYIVHDVTKSQIQLSN